MTASTADAPTPSSGCGRGDGHHKLVVEQCSIGGCSKEATAVLSSAWCPGNQWKVCDNCQWLFDPNAADFDENGLPDAFRGRGTTRAVTFQGNHSNGHKEETPPGILKETTTSFKNNQNLSFQETRDKGSNEKPSVTPTTLYHFEKVLSFRKLTGARIKKCNVDGCSLPACSLWKLGDGWNTRKRIYVCLDCQERKFGGWPSPSELLGKSYMNQEKHEVISRNCSKQSSPTMPPAFVKNPVK